VEAYSFKLCKNIAFSVSFSCGCKTWFLSLRAICRPTLMGLNNKVLYRVFESKREEDSCTVH
jgi:hypothetical protein